MDVAQQKLINLKSKRGRAFVKIRAGVDIAHIRNDNIAHWILTTAPHAKTKDIVRDFHVLRKRIYRKWKFSPSYSRAKTPEGNGVLHILVRGKKIFVSQKWLSKNWNEIHGSPIVYIKKAPSDLYKYVASQYVRDQPDPSFAYSRDWVYTGFWRDCKYLRNACRDWSTTLTFTVNDFPVHYSPIDYQKLDSQIYSLLLFKNGVDPPQNTDLSWKYVPSIIGYEPTYSSHSQSNLIYNTNIPTSPETSSYGDNWASFVLNKYKPLLLGQTLTNLTKK